MRRDANSLAYDKHSCLELQTMPDNEPCRKSWQQKPKRHQHHLTIGSHFPSSTGRIHCQIVDSRDTHLTRSLIPRLNEVTDLAGRLVSGTSISSQSMSNSAVMHCPGRGPKTEIQGQSLLNPTTNEHGSRPLPPSSQSCNPH